MSNGFKVRLAQRSQEIESYLEQCLQVEDIPEQLRQAMEYSLLAGGKRMRPVLCLAWGEMLGVSKREILSFAAGLEFMHTYSLVHDDLPAMDNDDTRRGKPTNHKVYGEALAILTGDALLTQAFYMMLSTSLTPARVLPACREVAHAAGPWGMVGGQCLDTLATGQGIMDVQALKNMHAMKTGALIRAACCSGAVLAGHEPGESSAHFQNAGQYGTNIGLAFQIMDDVLDVTGDEEALGKPVGSDVTSDKSTYPKFLGLEKSRELAQESVDQALLSLQGYHGEHKEFLRDLAQYIVDRAS